MKEFKAYLESSGQKYSDWKVKEIFNRVDTDNSGYIEYEEFLVASMDLHLFNQDSKTKMLRDAFNSFKMSDSSLITRDNLTKAFTKFGVDIGDDELDIYFKNNPDGIDYDQFRLLINK